MLQKSGLITLTTLTTALTVTLATVTIPAAFGQVQWQNNQQNAINQEQATGMITPGQAANLDNREAQIRAQEQQWLMTQGGRLTPQQQQQIDSELHNIGKHMRHDLWRDGQQMQGFAGQNGVFPGVMPTGIPAVMPNYIPGATGVVPGVTPVVAPGIAPNLIPGVTAPVVNPGTVPGWQNANAWQAAQQNAINQAAASGAITPGQAAHLDGREAQIQAQEQQMLRQNGGYLTPQQQSQLGSEMQSVNQHARHDAWRDQNGGFNNGVNPAFQSASPNLQQQGQFQGHHHHHEGGGGWNGPHL